MLGFGRKKGLPNPATNTTPSTTQDYMSAMGLPAMQTPQVQTEKKKKPRLDSGGQLLRGSNRMA